MIRNKTTPRHSTPPVHRKLWPAAVAIGLSAALGLSACSLLPGGGSATSEVTSEAPSPASTPTGKPSATQVLAEKVQTQLSQLGKTASTPNREQMMAAMVDAGAAKDTVEVSLDKTPTGLAVDAIEAAARTADECVIGQVRDGKAVVVILPVLATGLCFVGNQH